MRGLVVRGRRREVGLRLEIWGFDEGFRISLLACWSALKRKLSVTPALQQRVVLQAHHPALERMNSLSG